MKELSIVALVIVIGCSSQKSATISKGGQGDTRTEAVEMLNDNAYLLTETTEDKTYAYDQSNPVKVGGINDQAGPRNERLYLNGLTGPNGEEIMYARAGSCCHFKTPNGFIENTGMLDIYRITWTGSKDTLSIYLNMYDKGDLKIPVGLGARKKE